MLNNGDIYLFGSEYDELNETYFPVCLKYDKTGHADETFGENGVLKLESINGIFYNGLIDSSNKIFLFGTTDFLDDGPSDLLFARYKENSSSSHEIQSPESDLKLYPNPNPGKSFFISFEDNNKILAIELFDLNGKLIKTLENRDLLENNIQEIDLPTNLNTGIYLVKIKSTDGIVNKKLEIIK